MERRFKSICRKEYHDRIIKNGPNTSFSKGSVYSVLYMENEPNIIEPMYLVLYDGVRRDAVPFYSDLFSLHFYIEDEMREINIDKIINED